MKNSGLPYQKFMGDFAQPSKDAEGNLVPSEDAVAKFAAQERERMVKAAEKKRTGVSGLLRNLKGSSNNLRRSKGVCVLLLLLLLLLLSSSTFRSPIHPHYRCHVQLFRLTPCPWRTSCVPSELTVPRPYQPAWLDSPPRASPSRCSSARWRRCMLDSASGRRR